MVMEHLAKIKDRWLCPDCRGVVAGNVGPGETVCAAAAHYSDLEKCGPGGVLEHLPLTDCPRMRCCCGGFAQICFVHGLEWRGEINLRGES